jgi:hypothetical protein
MPDVFAGSLFLSAFLLAFDDGLHLARKLALAVILTISVIVHMSLFPIAILFIGSLAVHRFFIWRKDSIQESQTRGSLAFRPAASLLAWLIVPLIVATLGTATLNRDMGLGFKLAPSRNTFFLARLFSDGLAEDYLRDHCPQDGLISCRYLSHLPATGEDFLFRHPLLNELAGHDDEAETIIRGALLARPMRFAIDSSWETIRQIVSLRTNEEFRSYGSIFWTVDAIKDLLPNDFHAFSNSRQFRNRILRQATIVSVIHIAVFWLSLGACLMLARSGISPRINEFFYSTLVFLFINALICATLAGVFDRYQSRVEWLIPFCLVLYLCALVTKTADDGTLAPSYAPVDATSMSASVD